MRCFGFPFLPLVLGVVLGHLVEVELPALAGALRRRPRDLPRGSDRDRPARRSRSCSSLALARARTGARARKAQGAHGVTDAPAPCDDGRRRRSPTLRRRPDGALPPRRASRAPAAARRRRPVRRRARAPTTSRAALASLGRQRPAPRSATRAALGRYDAALVNGTAAHGEDYDDTFEGGPVHAGAVDRAGRARGRRAARRSRRRRRCDGIAVGIELMCRMSLVAPQAIHKAGFHPTAVLGALGCGRRRRRGARPRRRTRSRTRSASPAAWPRASSSISPTAAGPSGCMPAAAAQSGIRAALLARGRLHRPAHGARGQPRLLPGLRAVADAPDFAPLLDGLGDALGAARRSPSSPMPAAP